MNLNPSFTTDLVFGLEKVTDPTKAQFAHHHSDLPHGQPPELHLQPGSHFFLPVGGRGGVGGLNSQLWDPKFLTRNRTLGRWQ